MKELIIGAMEEEIIYLTTCFPFKKIGKINSNSLYLLEVNDKLIYLLNSGIGKVNATITLSMFLNNYVVDHILSIGTSGSLDNDLQIGDFVNGVKLSYHDVDLTDFGYELGKLPKNEKYFKTTQNIKFLEVLKYFKQIQNIQDGLILTGDQFISVVSKRLIKEKFPEALVVEMESTAMVHTAQAFEVEIDVLRVVSDSFTQEASIEFKQFLKSVCLTYQKLLQIMLEV